MTSNELIQIGHDFGFDTSELKGEIIALLECVAEHAEAKERTARQEAQAMAECLDMLRTDLIAAGVVGPEVAPMFLTEAVLSAVSLERAARIEAQQRLADMQELAAKAGLATGWPSNGVCKLLCPRLWLRSGRRAKIVLKICMKKLKPHIW